MMKPTSIDGTNQSMASPIPSPDTPKEAQITIEDRSFGPKHGHDARGNRDQRKQRGADL
jgi:hypothetical protein